MSYTPPTYLTLIFANLEHNGGGPGAPLWEDFHSLMRDHQPHALLRAEMRGAADDGDRGLYAAEEALTPPGQPLLRPRGWLGGPTREDMADLRTALFLRPDVFAPVNSRRRGEPWGIPPTVATTRLVRHPGDPDCRRETLIGAAHHAYASAPARATEAPELTKILDRRDPGDVTPEHRTGRPREAMLALDANSYPGPGADGDVPPPDPESITDRTHLVHRFTRDADGTWHPDTASDDLLRAAGMHDAARHLACTRPDRANTYLAPTTRGWPQQGGPSRIDRWYLTEGLLDAVHDLEVISLKGISDHHAVKVTMHRTQLALALSFQVAASG